MIANFSPSLSLFALPHIQTWLQPFPWLIQYLWPPSEYRSMARTPCLNSLPTAISSSSLASSFKVESMYMGGVWIFFLFSFFPSLSRIFLSDVWRSLGMGSQYLPFTCRRTLGWTGMLPGRKTPRLPPFTWKSSSFQYAPLSYFSFSRLFFLLFVSLFNLLFTFFNCLEEQGGETALRAVPTLPPAQPRALHGHHGMVSLGWSLRVRRLSSPPKE